jgi:hypothetical protein
MNLSCSSSGLGNIYDDDDSDDDDDDDDDDDKHLDSEINILYRHKNTLMKQDV